MKLQNSLTSKQQEVHLVVNVELLDVWSSNHYIRVASVLFSLGLDVSKGSRDTKSSREYTVWSVDYVWVWLSLACLLAHQGVVLSRLIGYSLDLLVIPLRDSKSLVYLTTAFKYSLLLLAIIRLVILRQSYTEVASIRTQNSSTVTHVDDKDSLLDKECHDGTRPTSIEHVGAAGCEVLDGVQEVLLGFLVAIDDGLSGICWEVRVFDDELVEVVSEEVGAGVAAVAVEDAEEGTFWPVFNVLFAWGLHDVEHDADTVFVVVTDDTLVCVCCVADDGAVLANAAFGGLPLGKVDRNWVHWWVIGQQKSLNIEFLWPSVSLSAVCMGLNNVRMQILVHRGRLGGRSVGVFSAVCHHRGK